MRSAETVLGEKGFVDGERCAGSFGHCDDEQLNVSRSIPGHEDPVHVRAARRPLRIESATSHLADTETLKKTGGWCWPTVKNKARRGSTSPFANTIRSSWVPVPSSFRSYPLVSQSHSVELAERLAAGCCAIIRAQHDVVAP